MNAAIPRENRPRISVLIPCRQHGHWLDGALASVFAQTLPGIEAVVVNDGSTDTTADVARAWQKSRPGLVHYLETPCVGQARARRAALERAAGEFFITLDADDRLERGMAAECLAALERNPRAALAAADVWMVDESGCRALRRLAQGPLPAWPGVLESNPLGGVAGLLVRAEAARRVGGLSLDGPAGAEDWDFTVRLSRAGMNAIRVPRALARYRQSAASHSRNPVPVLRAKIEMLDRCRQPDPRLSVPPEKQPVADETTYRRCRNRCVFFALGLSAGGAAAAIPEILSLLAPGGVDREACAASFAHGAAHGGRNGMAPRAAAAAVREPLARAMEAGGLGGCAAELAAALERAAARTRVKGPRYWLRRLEAWRATRRFRNEEGAA